MTYAVEAARGAVFARLPVGESARAVFDPGIFWGSWQVPAAVQVGVVAVAAVALLGLAVGLFARTE